MAKGDVVQADKSFMGMPVRILPSPIPPICTGCFDRRPSSTTQYIFNSNGFVSACYCDTMDHSTEMVVVDGRDGWAAVVEQDFFGVMMASLANN